MSPLPHARCAHRSLLDSLSAPENVSSFDFALGDDNMARIDWLDRAERLGPDPASFDF